MKVDIESNSIRALVIATESPSTTDLGGLQGDVQCVPFADRGFMNAALDATEILRAYAGRDAGLQQTPHSHSLGWAS